MMVVSVLQPKIATVNWRYLLRDWYWKETSTQGVRHVSVICLNLISTGKFDDEGIHKFF